jgi:aryl-alcohol dehydrogenase-like predicted oxidoreductase
MQYARLGSSGLKVSRIILGMMSYGSQTERRWHLSQDEAEPIVRRAVEAGVTCFDTADVYSAGMTEEITGRLLAKLFPSRDDYVLATKVYFPMGPGPNDRGLSRKHVLAGIDASLRRLGTDHVDLYQIHRWDDETYNDDDFDVVDVVRAVAAERGLPPAQIALAWLLGKPAVTAPIVGATRLHHLEDAIAAVDVTLSEEEMAHLEAPYHPHPVLGHH